MSAEDAARARDLLRRERMARRAGGTNQPQATGGESDNAADPGTTADLRRLQATQLGVRSAAGYPAITSRRDGAISLVIENDGTEPRIAVRVATDRVGELSQAQAGKYTPLLIELGARSFLVDGSIDSIGRVRVSLPTLPALRYHVQLNGVRAA